MKWSTLSVVICTIIINVFLYCEYFVYFVVLMQCNWPKLNNVESNQLPIKSMILADTHLLGPVHGNWFDKLRREWQMHRAFQSSLTLFHPEVVFILGDLFDEGYFVDNDQFYAYVQRFHKIFHTPKETKIISIVGNHDVGFHYRMHPFFTNRFEEQFNNTSVNLYTIRNVHFVFINSMAMKNDNCYFCQIAQDNLRKISKSLKCLKDPQKCGNKNNLNVEYSQPIIMQHFPTFRPSDETCLERDTEKLEPFRENEEVVSKDSTDLLGKLLNPRLAFSGHIHDYCKTKNQLGIDEYTVASFNWRNKINPSFLLATFTMDEYEISLCHMPNENTVIAIYTVGTAFICLLIITNYYFMRIIKRKTE